MASQELLEKTIREYGRISFSKLRELTGAYSGGSLSRQLRSMQRSAKDIHSEYDANNRSKTYFVETQKCKESL